MLLLLLFLNISNYYYGAKMTKVIIIPHVIVSVCVSVYRPSASRAVTLCLIPTWMRVVCGTTPACVSAVTLCRAEGCTPETLSRLRIDLSVTTMSRACTPSGRAKVTHSGPLLRLNLDHLLTRRTHDDLFSLFISELIHRFITEHQQGKRVPLCINPQSAAFKTFIR